MMFGLYFWLLVLAFVVKIEGEFRFDFDNGVKDEIEGLRRTESQVGEIREEMKDLLKYEIDQSGKKEKPPKPFKKFLKTLKRALNDAEDENNASLKKLKTTVDTLMAKVDEAYVDGEKSLARIIVQRNEILTKRVRRLLHSMAATQKWLLDLSTNIVVLIARKSLLN